MVGRRDISVGMSDDRVQRRTRSGRVLGSGAYEPVPPQEANGPDAAARRRHERAEELKRLRQEEEDLNAELELQERQNRIHLARQQLSITATGTVRATPSIAPPESEATTAPSLHDASSRSSGSIRLATPETYYGKSLKEHTNFMWQCDVNFRRDPRQFSDDASKVLYAMQYLRAEPRDRWRAQEATFGRDQATWQEFSDFLLDLIQNPVNRLLTQAQRYSDARQKPNQSVHSYVTYVENLEDELEPYSEDQRRLHLLTTLRPELRTAITSHQNIPESRAGLIALAARLEENLGATHGHSATKSTGPRRAPAQTANTNVNTNSSTNPNTIPVGGTRM